MAFFINQPFFWYLSEVMQGFSICQIYFLLVEWLQGKNPPLCCDICLIYFDICLIYFGICLIQFDISENSYCGRVLTCWVVAGDKSPAFSKSSHHFLLEATPQSRQLFFLKLIFWQSFKTCNEILLDFGYFDFSPRLKFGRLFSQNLRLVGS